MPCFYWLLSLAALASKEGGKGAADSLPLFWIPTMCSCLMMYLFPVSREVTFYLDSGKGGTLKGSHLNSSDEKLMSQL